MANTGYAKGREHILDGDISWTRDNIRMMLIDTDNYTPDFENDEYLSAVPSSARVASAALEGRTATSGVGDAADVTFEAVSGPTCEAVIVYLDTGSAGSSYLITYIDDSSNLPFTPAGGNVAMQISEAGLVRIDNEET